MQDNLSEAILQKILNSKDPITVIHKPQVVDYEEKFKGLEDKIGDIKIPDVASQIDSKFSSFEDRLNTRGRDVITDMSDNINSKLKGLEKKLNNNESAELTNAFSAMIEQFLNTIKKLSAKKAPIVVNVPKQRQNTGLIKAFDERIEKLKNSLSRERNKRREADLNTAFEEKAKRRKRKRTISEPLWKGTKTTFGTDN